MAEFPVRVQLLTVNVPCEFVRPAVVEWPLAPAARLSVTAQPLIVRVPSLSIPPPEAVCPVEAISW
jgi:hypothetical protein